MSERADKGDVRGGRGARIGVDNKGKNYGESYKTVAMFDNVKVIMSKSDVHSSPMESKVPHRIYAYLDNDKLLRSIVFTDNKGDRYAQVDFHGTHTSKLREKTLQNKHVHFGYNHNEKWEGDFYEVSAKMQSKVNSILNTLDKVKLWL